MYWRLRLLSPKELLHGYVPIAVAAGSICLNVVLYTMLRTHASTVPAVTRLDCEGLAQKVAMELLDSSYLRYDQNTQELLQGRQLAPNVIKAMQQKGLLPATTSEMKATGRLLAEEKKVSAVRIDSLRSSTQLTPQGYVPVDIEGLVAAHSASGATESKFHLRFLIGSAGGRTGPQEYIVAELEEVTPH